MPTCDRSLCWFWRDLRSHDHAALHFALRLSRRVWCTFVFDTGILDALPDRSDRRVEFIWHSLWAEAVYGFPQAHARLLRAP
jgi:deoxyribodipyrimidine photo-lyase